jgi:hypothetical protein
MGFPELSVSTGDGTLKPGSFEATRRGQSGDKQSLKDRSA